MLINILSINTSFISTQHSAFRFSASRFSTSRFSSSRFSTSRFSSSRFSILDHQHSTHQHLVYQHLLHQSNLIFWMIYMLRNIYSSFSDRYKISEQRITSFLKIFQLLKINLNDQRKKNINYQNWKFIYII